MSDDGKHLEDELFSDIEEDTTEDDGSTGGESTDDPAGQPEDESDENSKEVLRLEKQRKFAEDWAAKIKAGKATIEELQEKQSWLVPQVQKLITPETKVDHAEIARVAEEAARKAFQEEREKLKRESEVQEFEKLRSEVNGLATAEQKRAMNSEYKQLLSEGLSPLRALNIAARAAQVDFEGVNARRSNFPRIQVGGGVPPTKEVDYDKLDPNAIPLEVLQEQKRKKLGL